MTDMMPPDPRHRFSKDESGRPPGDSPRLMPHM